MKDFNQLKNQLGALQQQRSGSVSQRSRAFEEHLYRGLAALDQAASENFQDPFWVKGACEQLIEAMKRNAKDSRPVLGLGLLFMMIGNYAIANDYLNLALQLDYENPMAQTLAAALKEMMADEESQAPSLQVADIESDELDFDALYDETEDFIVKAIQFISSRPPPQPTLEPDTYKQLKAFLATLLAHQETIVKQLTIIDAEIDTGELEAQMRPLGISVKRYQDTIATSKTCLQLKKQIQAEQASAEAYTQEVLAAEQVDQAKYEALLETIFDRCDGYADALDDLSEAGHDIGKLTAYYDKLIKKVDKFQDALDGA